MARRDRWQEQSFMAAIHGIKPGPEPDWGLDDQPASGPRRGRYTKQHASEFAAMRADYTARNSDADGRKFPGTL